MKPTLKTLSLKDAIKLGKKGDFFKNVKEEIIPKLIKLKKLKGKSAGEKTTVVDDVDFRTMMQLGIESFVQDKQGWSFTAIKAPIEDVARVLKNRKGVLEYSENAKPSKMTKDAAVASEEDKRHVFVVKMAVGDWTVIIQTVHWIQSCDMMIGLLLAAELSGTLKTTAIAAWDDDFSGSTGVVCKDGKRTKNLTDEEDWADFYLYFYEQGIYLPDAFISTKGKEATLLVEDPAQVQRADRAIIAVPTESQSSGPHVFYKLGMFAAAMEAEDEEDFREQMVDSLWKQVEANLKSK